MEVKRTHVLFDINFTSEELKVVGKALNLATTGGRLKDEKEIRIATELNLRILEGRKRVLEEQVQLVDGVLERLAGVNQPCEQPSEPAVR